MLETRTIQRVVDHAAHIPPTHQPAEAERITAYTSTDLLNRPAVCSALGRESRQLLIMHSSLLNICLQTVWLQTFCQTGESALGPNHHNRVSQGVHQEPRMAVAQLSIFPGQPTLPRNRLHLSLTVVCVVSIRRFLPLSWSRNTILNIAYLSNSQINRITITVSAHQHNCNPPELVLKIKQHSTR